MTSEDSEGTCWCVRAPIEMKSSALGRLQHDLSNGMQSDVIGDSKTFQPRLGGTGERESRGFLSSKNWTVHGGACKV